MMYHIWMGHTNETENRNTETLPAFGPCLGPGISAIYSNPVGGVPALVGFGHSGMRLFHQLPVEAGLGAARAIADSGDILPGMRCVRLYDACRSPGKNNRNRPCGLCGSAHWLRMGYIETYQNVCL